MQSWGWLLMLLLPLPLPLPLLLTYLPSGSAEHRSEVRGFGEGVFERSEFP